jgi:hypothetical protein
MGYKKFNIENIYSRLNRVSTENGMDVTDGVR